MVFNHKNRLFFYLCIKLLFITEIEETYIIYIKKRLYVHNLYTQKISTQRF